MIEVTLRRFTDEGPMVTQSFQFENDALQAFLVGSSPDAVFVVAELRALGTPVVAVGRVMVTDEPKQKPKPAAPEKK